MTKNVVLRHFKLKKFTFKTAVYIPCYDEIDVSFNSSLFLVSLSSEMAQCNHLKNFHRLYTLRWGSLALPGS